jgi:hypothetical protein
MVARLRANSQTILVGCLTAAEAEELNETEQLADAWHEQWNAMREAEAEARYQAEYCDCVRAHPDCPNLTPGHVCGDCDCQCNSCWSTRSAVKQARQQTHQDGSCHCARFWDWREHNIGTCGCTCEDCLARQADFAYEEEKRLVQVRLDYWSSEAGKDPREYPYGHDEWCSCQSCEPITEFNAEIERARIEVHKARSWLNKREKQEHEIWLQSAEGIAETARLAEIEVAKQRELAEETRRKMVEISIEGERLELEGPPYEEPVAIEGDQYRTYQAMLRFASCGDPDDTTRFGRLFLADPGNHRPLRLVKLVSNEDCSFPLHVQFRSKHAGVRICTAACGSTFSVMQIKTRQQADAVLDEQRVNAWLLPSAGEILEEGVTPRWLGVRDVIGDEARDAVWAAQDFIGFWRLDRVYELPDGWEESSLSPGYSAENQTWFELPRRQQIALPPSKPKELAGQLQEVARGNFAGYVSDLADLLNKTYGGRWTPHSLPRAVTKLQPVLSALGIYAGPGGETDSRTRRPVWIVVARNVGMEVSSGSGRLEILPPAETPGDARVS